MALTAAQTTTLPLSFSGVRASFVPFDLGLGTLVAARMTIGGRLVGTLALENTDARAASVSTTVTARVQAYGPFLMPSGDLLSSTNTALGAYDGTDDFAGTSGVSGLVLDSGDVSREEIYTGELLQLFQFPFQIEPRIFPIELTTSGGSLRQRYDVIGEVTASLRYEYTPFDAAPTAATAVLAAQTSLPAPPSAAATGPLTMTSAVQRASLAARPAGWQDTVTVARFDAALGTLKSVNIRLAGTLAAGAELDAGSGFSIALRQQAGIELALAGGGEVLADLGLDTQPRTLYDFTFTGHFSQALGLAGSTGIALTDSAAMAPFIGAGALDLAIGSSGTSAFSIEAASTLASLQLAAGARLEVSYTYEPATPVAPIKMTNVTSGASGTPTPLDYTGPVAGIGREFAMITPDNIALSADTDGWYIRTGDGNDAIRVSGGVNVLDGGAGSNFLVGGAGADTFFVDAQWVQAPIWSTIANLGSGDAVTIWGITQSYHSLAWRDGLGAPGYEGLTLLSRMPGGPLATTTLSGYTRADLDNGRLVTSFGTVDDTPYFSIQAI